MKDMVKNGVCQVPTCSGIGINRPLYIGGVVDDDALNERWVMEICGRGEGGQGGCEPRERANQSDAGGADSRRPFQPFQIKSRRRRSLTSLNAFALPPTPAPHIPSPAHSTAFFYHEASSSTSRLEARPQVFQFRQAGRDCGIRGIPVYEGCGRERAHRRKACRASGNCHRQPPINTPIPCLRVRFSFN